MKAFLMHAAFFWLGTGLPCGLLAGADAAGLSGEAHRGQALSLPVLYENEANPWVQRLALAGQLQLQYAHGSDDSGNYGTGDYATESTWGDIEVRRLRTGMRGQLFRNLFFSSQVQFNADFSPRFYKRIQETYVTWKDGRALNVSAGKYELKFNREQEFTSREFPAFERTALGNMFYAGELAGAWVTGEEIAGGWLYYLGVYSNERGNEWPGFGGGAIILGKIGYNYAAATPFDLAQIKAQWLHNTEPGHVASADYAPSPLYSDCVSISNEITDGRFGHITEFMWGDGAQGRPDVCGLSAMTTWFLTEKLQFVSVLELAGSRDENGVILPARYEALSPGAGDKRGDAYFASYAGLNYHIDGHQLKLMSGVKYSRLDGGPGGGDFNGWTWLAGLRMAF